MKQPPQMIPWSKEARTAAKYFPMMRKKKMSATQAAYHNHIIQLYMAQATAPSSAASLWSNMTTNTIPIPTLTTVTNSGSFTVTATGPVVVCPDYFPDDYPGQPLRRGVGYPPIAVFDDPNSPPIYKIADGRPTKLSLPDGTMIDVKTDGSYVIDDADAQVVYRANRVRDFNSYLNASDKLEDFIRYCGAQGVRQDEMLSIPIKHFIAWLIVESALADGEEPPAALPDLRDFCEPQLLLEAAE